MPDDPIAALLTQAETSDPPVKAAALMRIARVQTAIDPAVARRTFERGLEEARRLSSHDRDAILDQARLLAAAVAPDLLGEIPVDPRSRHPFMTERIGKVMLEHEHGDAAHDYVVTYPDPATFPFGLVSSLLDWYGDDERRLALLRRAVEAWRAAPRDERPFIHLRGFIHLFQSRWNVLPFDEARELAREIVRETVTQPDSPANATYSQEVVITSMRQHTLFSILHVLRRLDPPLAESLIAEHEQLAAAARRFPNGRESIMENVERRQAASPAPAGRGYGMAGNPRDFPYMTALMQASDDGEFAPAVQHAWEQYRQDADPERPNLAPREFWNSTSRFRAILYNAGKQLGRDAEVWLDRIPDDLRLFAHIEFEAALAGLPELQGMIREQRQGPGANLRRGIF